MFRQNAYVSKGLTKEQIDNQYFLLYYQFIKHSFGLDYCNTDFENNLIALKLYFDQLPDTKDKCNSFKEHIYSLNNILNLNNIFIAKEKLYNVILKNIKKIHPNFNIGISTGDRGDVRNRWFDAYRHWNFIAKNDEFDKTLTKKK